MKRYMTAPELGQNFGRVVRVGEAGEFYLLSYSGLRKNGGGGSYRYFLSVERHIRCP